MLKIEGLLNCIYQFSNEMERLPDAEEIVADALSGYGLDDQTAVDAAGFLAVENIPGFILLLEGVVDGQSDT